MRNQAWRILLFVFALGISGCANTSLAAAPDPTTTPQPVQDKAAFITKLQEAGATVEVKEHVVQPFFTPEGTILRVNQADVQVFQYESVEAMEEEALQVTPEGGSIGTVNVTWIDTPHFYKAGKIIVLYVGSDEEILGLLEKVLGPQFAGG